jgi:hypothetical protein
MKNKYIGSIAAMLTLLFIASCTKTEVKYEDGRPTIVRTPNAVNEINVVAREVLPAIEEFDLLVVDRSATRPEDLNSSLTVKVTKNTVLITDYNSAHGGSFIELPASAYTLSSDLNNLVFAPGEAIKVIKIRIDKGQLDLSKQYALGFTISEVGTGAKISVLKDALFSIGIKNKYHASYHSTGVFHHPTAGDRNIDEDKELQTAGPNSVKANLGDLGTSGYQMILTVDPITNLVTITPAGITPNIDQSWGPNFYDPATKTFHLYYSYNTAAPRKVEEAIKRL